MIAGILILINIIFYLVLAYMSSNALEIDPAYMLKLGFEKEAFLAGAYWQIFTSMFMHFDFPHLGYNMIFLAIFGYKAEEIFGKRFLFIYLTCGLLASLPAFLYPLTVSAGSSGCVFGILGANLAAQRALYPRGIWTSILYGFIFFILAAAAGFLAHFLGLVFGFLIGYWITRDWYPEDQIMSLK